MRNPRTYWALVFAALLMTAPTWLSPAAAETDHATLFSAARYADHVRYLASDELGGRRPGQPGIELAADYIAGKFREAGLKPGGENDTYFQEFEINDGKRILEDVARLETSGTEQRWQVSKDWTPVPLSAEGEAEGPLAFAGYGIEAPDHEYNDYADFKADGKVLLIIRYEPKNSDPAADFGGKERSAHSLFTNKARKAAQHGAKAVLFVNPPGEPKDADELYAFKRSEMFQTVDLPFLNITREMADVLLKQAGMPDLKTLRERIDSTRKPMSQDMNITVKLNAGIGPSKIKTRNVLGMLPGSGSTDEMIVVGAHYDHLGFVPRFFGGGDDTSVIHNGADDNASGSAGVIELAHAFGQGPKTRRNILFMTFSAEEMGLLGSRHFVDHPTVDLGKVRAMINLDMIGRYGQHKFEIYGAETGEGLDDVIRKAADKVGVEYRATPQSGPFFGASDHASFHRKNIPVLFPFTGMHKQYHQPEDDWELIDSAGATRVLEMMHLVLCDVANMESGPAFVKAGRTRSRRDRQETPAEVAQAAEAGADTKATADAGSDDAQAPKMPTARLGIMPGYAQDGKAGMLVDGLRDDGPAQKAGIQQGDRVLKIGDKTIKDVYSYMDAMAGYKPGDSADIVVEREGKQLTFKVTFTAAAPPSNEKK